MRRSICSAKPSVALAGQTGIWRFIYTPSTNLPAKTLLKFDINSTGSDIEWEIPQTNARSKNNLIWLNLPSGETLFAKPIEDSEGYRQFEFSLPKEISAGEELIFQIGTNDPANAQEKGNRCQSHVQRRRPFYLYIDPKGKGEYSKEPEVFSLDVRGNKLENIRVIGPSITHKNQRFDLILRFEDKHGNLTGNAPEGTLVELTYDRLRENLNWKVFVPETGFLTLPNLYFNEEGIYRIKLKNLNTKQEFISPPIQCYLNESDQLFWGLLHSESRRFRGAENVENALRNFRDDKALHFYATSVPEDEKETSNDDWKLIGSQVAQFNEEERFVSMLGFEWLGEPKTEGCRLLIYPKDNKPLLRTRDPKSNSLKKIYRMHRPKELLSIPSLTMGKGYSFDFENFNPLFERVVEIYNAWGSSECSKKKGNPRPIQGSGRKGITEVEEGSIRKALDKNHRFGFVAGGLDTRGAFKDFAESGQTEYSPGATAIFSADYSREALFNALYNRRCYATTGARILVSFNIANQPLGSEISTKDKPGLIYNRHITASIAGTCKITEVLIIRNGVELKTLTPNEDHVKIAYDDPAPLAENLLKSRGEDSDFAYYYLRITQEDGEIAWVTPIWIDYVAPPPPTQKKGKKKA